MPVDPYVGNVYGIPRDRTHVSNDNGAKLVNDGMYRPLVLQNLIHQVCKFVLPFCVNSSGKRTYGR